MAVGIIHFHFSGPREIPGGMTNPGAAGLVFFVKSLDILDADPDPRSRLPLAPSAEVDSCGVTVHRREIVSAPVRVLEPRHIDVIPKADRHIRDI